MIRQLGIPNFFITLSAAETQWGVLLKILKKVIDNVDLTVKQAELLPFTEKARLINSDPVTCARYFDNRMKAFLKLIKSKNGFFENHPCKDYYWRIEVQQRGSLHLHGIFWMENIPIFNKDDNTNWDQIIKVIDQNCTTYVSLLDNENLAKLQYEKSKT